MIVPSRSATEITMRVREPMGRRITARVRLAVATAFEMIWLTSAALKPPSGPAAAETKNPSGGALALATGPRAYAPFKLPGATPAGAVVWFTNGNVTPLMTTTPGDGGLGAKPFVAMAVNAAYSATSLAGPTTPIPPTACPPLKTGTPPGLTAAGSLSFTSALPVVIPRLGCAPLMERAGGNACPAM